MSKPKVFITRNDFPCVIVDMLSEKFEVVCWQGEDNPTKKELIENIKGKFALVCYPANKIDKEVIQATAKDLKVVATYSVGTDHLDIAELKSRGIKIGFTPDVLTESVAEFALSLALATSRRVVETHNLIKAGGWTSKVWSPEWMCGYGLNESIVGIVGCGRIGLSILEKVKSFRPSRLLYFNRQIKEEATKQGAKLTPLDELMRESDFIFVTLPQTDETKGIINKFRISLMKPRAIIVNTGRGGLIDEPALCEALQNKKIAGAGLDVFQTEPLPMDSPLLKLSNVVTTPHIASASYQCRVAMGKRVAENILAVIKNEKMPSEVA